VLRQLPVSVNENLLVSLTTSDDAAVYKLDDKRALILTMDFFTPVVDDPYSFGQIAAANALSDIYAMGGKPIIALNVVAFPENLVEDVLPEVLKGGFDKVNEAEAFTAGGHSIKSLEPIYGLSVVGEVSPDQVMTNAKAKPKDALILTKPLGTGVATTALKAGMLDVEGEKLVISVMSTLNKAASEACTEIGVNAITDITGFGLLGHAYEMAEASNVTMRIKAKALPLLPQVEELASMGILPGGMYHNKKYLEGKVRISKDVPESISDLAFDPQTSGGLLISVDADKALALLELLKQKGVEDAAIIGEITELSEHKIILEES
jgi:selenide,water dikinase